MKFSSRRVSPNTNLRYTADPALDGEKTHFNGSNCQIVNPAGNARRTHPAVWLQPT